MASTLDSIFGIAGPLGGLFGSLFGGRKKTKTRTETTQALKFPQAMPLFSAQTDLFRQALPFEQAGLRNLTALVEGRDAPGIVGPLRSAVDQARNAFEGSGRMGTTFDFDAALRNAVNARREQVLGILMGQGSSLVSPYIAQLASQVTPTTKTTVKQPTDVLGTAAQMAEVAAKIIPFFL